ncbi:hypothetical protein LCGC14_0619010 [marine sediment metagenome]|uniref:Uncharacterized protein n=1 Tax=marine sediment metagenome TaxID=412755 RepID=A0A0F9TRT6_9ZZZZ
MAIDTSELNLKNRYITFKKNLAIAERDNMCGLLPILDFDNPKLKPIKKIIYQSSQNESSTIEMTPKRVKIFFVRDYLKIFGKITAKGLARKYEGIFRKTRKKPNNQIIKDFTEILHDLVDLGKLYKCGSYRGNIVYMKRINPDNLEELRNHG